MDFYQKISLEMINDFNLNHYSDDDAKTGVSVIYFKNGARVGVDISGGGPASRETPLASPLTADNLVNAIVLAGGSAYGLAAADGVMQCLEHHNIGFNTGFAKVPLVLESCIYDLGYGKSKVRPDARMGYEACEKALHETSDAHGNVGGGTGATVGKLLGMKQACKSGLGIYTIYFGEIYLSAIVVVNALGDIFDMNGKKIAGVMNKERESYLSFESALAALPNSSTRTNTTIGTVVTNAKFNKAELNKIASMARNAYARSIDPVGTMADGDTIYACSVGEQKADVNIVGTLAAKVMQLAIVDAIAASRIDDAEYLSNCGRGE